MGLYGKHVLPKLVHRDFPNSPGFPESLQGDVQAHFVPEFEAVGDSLGRAVNLDEDSVHFVFFDTKTKSTAGKPHDFKGRILEGRLPLFVLDGDPHVMGNLCR